MIVAITPNGKFDYLAHTIVTGLQELNIPLFCTGTSNGEKNSINDQKFIKLKTQADFIFLIHGKKPGNYSLVNDDDWSKVVVVDGSEWSFNYLPPFGLDRLINQSFLDKAKFYFKRECYPYHMQKGIIPLPFGAVKTDFKLNNNSIKDIDLLCAFGQTKSYITEKSNTQWRQVAINSTKQLQKKGYKVIYTTVPDYLNHVNRSWITVDAFGGGECNGRTFQIPANNSLPFFKRFNIIIPNLLEDHHYIGWDSEEEFIEKAIYYLDNKNKISYLTKKSFDNLMKYHTAKKRAEYILNIINYSL